MLHDRIDMDTYRGSWYSGEFKEAFQWEDLSKIANKYVTDLFYDYSNITGKNKMPMTYDGESYGHHSSVSKQDVRRFMNKILNVEGLTSRIGSIIREPYWDNFTSEADMYTFALILKELKKLGIIYNFQVKQI